MKLTRKILTLLMSFALMFSLISCEDIVNEKSSDVLGEELKIHYIDVGQADSILIQQGNENLLIDAGNNDDRDTLKDYLKSVGVSKFKYVVGTHPHEDHIGSMAYIVNSYDVENIYIPKATATTKTFENLVNAAKKKNMQFESPKVGETFEVGKAKCTILAPNSTNYEDLNDYSIVIKVEYGSNSFLFTGDAETLSENEMLNKNLDVKADVLKVGHHGSRSSTSQNFLDKVNPKYAVISVGKGNDYGHPTQEVLNRLTNKGVKIFRTDESGTIVVTSDGTNIKFNDGTSSSSQTNTTNSSDKKGTSTTVWVSKNGGKAYHLEKDCSGMKDPEKMTLKEAQDKGLTPCKKCVG